ncbi:MAG: alpha/beta hydrolase [Acidobacteria bacterium]|nr:alpha/beta hydrolase [Acidobacteriota bacterium]
MEPRIQYAKTEDGISIAYSVTGEGPPLVLVHGYTGDVSEWENQIEEFAGEFRVLVLDNRGHGQSEAPADIEAYTVELMVEDTLAVIAVAGFEKYHLVGHSMGGYLVQRYLETHDVPAAILLAAVPPRGAIGVALRTLRAHPTAMLKTVFQLRLWPLVATPELTRDILMRSDSTDEEAQQLQARLQDDSFRAFLGMITRPVKKPKTSPPVLVMGAEQDRVVSPKEVQATAERYDTEAVMMPAMAHDMILDPEWQSIVDTMTAWIDETLALASINNDR